MKRTLTALLLGAGMAAAAFAGSSSITLTAPKVTSWHAPDGNTYTTSSDPSGYLAALNAGIASTFSDIQNTLNTDYIGNFHDLTDLSSGFANANMASFDNASLLGYQTYDLFSAMVGFNIAAAVPGFSPSAAASALNDVSTKGDTYSGLGTGGMAGQVGLNAGFSVPNLYLTGRLGYIPSFTSNDSTFQQSMFGIGANYTLVKQFDLLFGFMKWRGLSIGTGLNYNSVSVDSDVPVKSQSQDASLVIAGGNSEDITATTSNTKVKLSVTSSSVVIPIDLMTSAQLFWFFNVGLGVGADMSFSSAKIGVGADSDVAVSGITGVNTITPGTAKIVATNSKGNGDFFVPRLAASIGLALGIFKLDFPISYYPTTKAVALGITGGIVW